MFNKFITLFGNLLEPVMSFLYKCLGNYAFAIVGFTIFAKIILIPLTVALHMNSIKMVKMQPEFNFVKAKFGNDKERMSEEQLLLYKKYKYHPMLGLVPLVIQIILLMGIIDVVYRQLSAGMYLGIFNLFYIPIEQGGLYFIWVILAGISQLAMCLIQNKINVLQSEQGMVNKISTMVISTALTCYLGNFVRVAVLIYWIAGNTTSIIQLFLINMIISPKKYIDYEQLELSRKALQKSKRRSSQLNKKFLTRDPYRNKEKKDYKRFYSDYNKQIVFYAEGKGFYKYFKNTIEYILNNSDICVHYVTGDPNDPLLLAEKDNFKVYYIGTKRVISFMMKMDANVVVMSTPDLEKSYIKRSMIRDDIKYVYLPHGINSGNLTGTKRCFEHFDILLVPGKKGWDEQRAIEKLYGLKEKEMIEWGSALVDEMIEKYESIKENKKEGRKKVLIAPSWQDENIIEVCGEELIDILVEMDIDVVLRPHPQYVRYEESELLKLKDKYKDYTNFELEMDFSANNTVYEADVLITDWSSIALEYAYCTLKPVLFINTPMKVMNEDWELIDIVPIDIDARDKIGKSVNPDNLELVKESITTLLTEETEYRDKIQKYRSENLYYVGNCSEISGKYFIDLAKQVDDNKPEYLKYLSKTYEVDNAGNT